MTTLATRLAAGDKLHMQLVNGRRVWWFESPHQNIPDREVVAVLQSGGVGEAGDSLFGLPMNSQTWFAEDAGGGP